MSTDSPPPPPQPPGTPAPFPRFVVEPGEDGQTLAALIRAHGFRESWSDAKRLVTSGKVFVDGTAILDIAYRPRPRVVVELRERAPRPQPELAGRLVFDDSQIVVVDKPTGISSVPYDEREVGTAMDLIRDHWRRAGQKGGGSGGKKPTEQALHVVHRIDKETSGLLCFAKTKLAERFLQTRFREHTIERTYLCVVHGHLTDRRIESRLVEDRGDGLRGSTRELDRGKRAVTHVTVREEVGDDASLCEVRLETGKTHQIRIHLAENGHPIVGEKVYLRDYTRAGHEMLPSSRLLLHAATLGFPHPVFNEPLRFESPLPDDFVAGVDRLRRRRG